MTLNMAKTKFLNGLSYCLAQSYFSSLAYYEKGHMSDWIINSAYELGIKQLEIDIIEKKVTPNELNIKPILIHLGHLNSIIKSTLKSNNLPENFIIEAKFNIKIEEEKKLICSSYIVGTNKRIYKSKDYDEISRTNFKVL